VTATIDLDHKPRRRRQQASGGITGGDRARCGREWGHHLDMTRQGEPRADEQCFGQRDWRSAARS
jgi:hypothetical protein